MKQPRAYNTKTGELLPIASIWWGDDKTVGSVVVRCNDTVKTWVNNFTIERCTGLTDKNGVKIFEGDICKDSLGLTFVVEWDIDNARFIGYTTDTWDSNAGKYVQGERRIGYVSKFPKVGVIGNIHDKEDKE